MLVNKARIQFSALHVYMYIYIFFSKSNTFKQHVSLYPRVIEQDIIKCKRFAFLARAIVPNGRQ